MIVPKAQQRVKRASQQVRGEGRGRGQGRRIFRLFRLASGVLAALAALDTV